MIATIIPPFAVPSSFVSTMPVTLGRFVEELGLRQRVLAGGRVEHEQRLVRCAFHLAGDDRGGSSSALP